MFAMAGKLSVVPGKIGCEASRALESITFNPSQAGTVTVEGWASIPTRAQQGVSK